MVTSQGLFQHLQFHDSVILWNNLFGTFTFSTFLSSCISEVMYSLLPFFSDWSTCEIPCYFSHPLPKFSSISVLVFVIPTLHIWILPTLHISLPLPIHVLLISQFSPACSYLAMISASTVLPSTVALESHIYIFPGKQISFISLQSDKMNRRVIFLWCLKWMLLN